jgi:hypothetical protein
MVEEGGRKEGGEAGEVGFCRHGPSLLAAVKCLTAVSRWDSARLRQGCKPLHGFSYHCRQTASDGAPNGRVIDTLRANSRGEDSFDGVRSGDFVVAQESGERSAVVPGF